MSEKLPQNYIYPAVIETTVTNYCLFFPDLPGCVSSGDTITQAVELGKEAAQAYLWELERTGAAVPAPSDAASIELDEGDVVCYVDINMFAARSKMDHRTVKKTLTIPWYLNELAEARHINFSRTLREALQAQLAE